MGHHEEQNDAVHRGDIVPVLPGQRRFQQARGQQRNMYYQERNIGDDLRPEVHELAFLLDAADSQ